jgi:hypothetical protein
VVERMAREGAGQLPRLAVELGVDTEALNLLNVGYGKFQGSLCWTFPERTPQGLVVGITRRLLEPRNGVGKLCAKGGRRGLFFADNWASYNGPCYLVEGASDTAAGLTIGLCVIGRPNNLGGVDMLASLLANFSRPIVVIGERDKKPDGTWPGRTGMIETSKRLAKALRRPIKAMLPPDGSKDLRAWLNARDASVEDAAGRLGRSAGVGCLSGRKEEACR